VNRPTLFQPGSTILVLGSGPIVIGQACEFDYSGTQACKALKDLGYRVVLINSNPATIMTDPALADATYVEPLTVEFTRQVIARERPAAILPTVGGQVALNLALDLNAAGVLDEYNVVLLGADPETINLAEDRLLFKEAMIEIGVGVAVSQVVTDMSGAEDAITEIGLPAIIRPSFTLGGAGGGVVWNMDEYRRIVAEGLDASPVTQVLIEKSLLGWKEYELEVMRDMADNVIIICSIENLDPMGIHTGDSITVAPAQTLTDRGYQELRDLSLKIMRRVGVETGGSNVQFAVNPKNGDVIVIELNPRVSRSSALASKATGFPIAKIAAQLAVGMTLDQIDNDITRVTPACFEPALDYVIVKIPRWNFEKFSEADRRLGSAMRSVGEVMGIGGTFREALNKAISSLEGGWPDTSGLDDDQLREALGTATPDRLSALFEALRRGIEIDEIHQITSIDLWYLRHISRIVEMEFDLKKTGLHGLDAVALKRAKREGFSDLSLAKILGCTPAEIVGALEKNSVKPTYKRVDTCAAEFESHTPYLYSTYADECESGESVADRVVILGNGPNRIGQGLEFDYCCCHAALAVREMGLTSVMVNCNPETVSTDYDTSDKLYFEPITTEHVQNIMRLEKPRGVILQFGGQTPLKLSHTLDNVLGTHPDVIDMCEDRERFNAFCDEHNIKQPEGALAESAEEARVHAARIGYPVLVRPPYVLGGRAMAICYDEDQLDKMIVEAMKISESRALLVDRYLGGATEYDVDALCDGKEVYIGGIIEHIEEAGVHSGDSSGVLPPVQLSPTNRRHMEDQTTRMALALGVVGLLNIQFAIFNDELYVIEVNPRASRTVPFVAKATGIELAKLATRIILGETLADMAPIVPKGQGMYFIKAPVFPWRKFPGSDVVLGPEMRSTGEVMGVGWAFGEAYAKALIAAGMKLPTSGGVFMSFRDADKQAAVGIAGSLRHMGLDLYATAGTAQFLQGHGIEVTTVNKVNEGRPDIVDRIKNGEIQLILNTPLGKKAVYDEVAMRLAGLRYGVPCLTTISAASAVVSAIRSLRAGELKVIKLQEIS
jgi:carbamoyl-phosphate synthase large subunit